MNETFVINIDEKAEGSLLLLESLNRVADCERISAGVYEVAGDYATIVAITELHSVVMEVKEEV